MPTFMNDQNALLDWDDEIAEEEPALLPDGDYDFTIVNFERDRFSGSEKMPACNKAVVTLQIEHEQGATQVKHSFFMLKRNEGQLGEFFVCIGIKKRGEPLRPNWNAIIGAKGRCKLGRRTYNGKEYLEVKKFYEPTTVSPVGGARGFAGGF